MNRTIHFLSTSRAAMTGDRARIRETIKAFCYILLWK